MDISEEITLQIFRTFLFHSAGQPDSKSISVKVCERLTEASHTAGAIILAATHVHLDHNYCLDVVIMKGKSKELREKADRMLALRGVELGKSVLTNSGKELKHAKH